MQPLVPFAAPPLPVATSPHLRTDVTLAEIAPAAWDALAGDALQPFVTHAFLTALHETGCATPRTGWWPRYITAWHRDTLVGAMPLYAKTHSYGEYVFDWGWAEAYRRHGRRYYPKLVGAIPFTPVTGPRLIARDPEVRRALLAHAVDLVRDGEFSSLHVLFLPETEMPQARDLPLVARSGIQFHWLNAGYRDFDDFLAAFSHDKRKKVKQERRRLAAAGVTFERRCGRDISADDWAFFHRCYTATYRAHHSTPYLNAAFFARIGAVLPDNVVLVIGSRAGRRLCSALDVYDAGTLWGRYWGTVDEVPGLHFEACYYQAIEFCLERGIARFEGGAQGTHKLARGLRPVTTHSLHAIGDPAFAAAIADFCARERGDIAHARDALHAASPYRTSPAPASG
ncbi:MAG: N-acetyltransferase [Burkholderiales bacterium]|nr:N-acetyltransferase [Burkholderiales bacterium]